MKFDKLNPSLLNAKECLLFLYHNEMKPLIMQGYNDHNKPVSLWVPKDLTRKQMKFEYMSQLITEKLREIL